MFNFVVETMELYYKRKLVNIAHNRLESHIALRFQVINTQKIGKGDITKKLSLLGGTQSKARQKEVNPMTSIPTLEYVPALVGKMAHHALIKLQL